MSALGQKQTFKHLTGLVALLRSSPYAANKKS
jgi:hypothetical protein